MPRKVKSAALDTRSSRRILKASGKPHFVRLHDSLHLGYRRGMRKDSAGRWVVRRYLGDGKYVVETIGTADDLQVADGANILTFDQAQEAAREHAQVATEKKRPADAGPLATVRTAVDGYLVGRNARAIAQGIPKSDATYQLGKHVLADVELADTALIDLTAGAASQMASFPCGVKRQCCRPDRQRL
jgi:hypothetical protein